MKPQYPVYIPSKGRADKCFTALELLQDGVPFRLVVEPQEYEIYAEQFGEDPLLTLPINDPGTVVYARNWIKDHAISEGWERHWQLDDNIKGFLRRWKAQRIRCDAGLALGWTERFVDRYENIAIAGLNYEMFVPDGWKRRPFKLNCHVYSCTLVLNSIPHRWRGRYNEDTDICLQVLSDGWCTLLMNAFLARKMQTMQVKGGNTDALYQDDGRVKMARALERLWPGVVTTTRRYGRPAHSIKANWRRFDTPLKLKPGIDLEDMPGVDEEGMVLTQVADEIKNDELRELAQPYLKGPG
jgi:hypothetical protein